MTQFVEPSKKSDLIAPRVLDWLRGVRRGVLDPMTVSYDSAYLINIASGRLIVDGTMVYDDAGVSQLDTGLSGTLGENKHILVHATYVYADPPAAMTYGVVITGGTAPTPPALPANSVKLADIFVASGATDLSAANIVQAQVIKSLEATDTTTIIERLAASNLNTIIDGGGIVTLAAGTLEWSSDITIYSPVITGQEKYNTPPLAIGTIAASTLASVDDDSILFTVIDRKAINTLAAPQTLAMKSLDLENGDFDTDFFGVERENIVWLGMVIGGVVKIRAGMGSVLPAPGADGDMYLRNTVAGAPYWDYIYADVIQSILSISSFTGQGAVELGVIVNNPVFAAVVTNDGGDGPTTAVLNPGSQNVVSDFGGGSSAPSITSTQTGLQKVTPGANGVETFTLTADDGATPDVETFNLNWWRYTYWGFEASNPGAGNYDNTFLKTTIQADQGGSDLRSGIGVTMIESAPASAKYFYFAYPAWKGSVTSIIDNNTGFEVISAFTEVDAAQAGITTASAIAENYRVWKSNNLLSGAVSFTIS